MRRLPVTLVLATALVAATLVTAPASAMPASDRRRDGDHFPASIETTVPAGGSASIGSPTLPKGVRILETTVALIPGASAAEKASFKSLTNLLASKKTKGEKLLTCVRLHQTALSDWDNQRAQVKISESDERVAQAMMLLGGCLELAGLFDQSAPSRARPNAAPAKAMKKCQRASHGLPMTLTTKKNGTRVLKVDGEATSTRSKLRVSCKAKGSKLVYRVQPRKKGVSLRKVVGPRLYFGLRSPSDAEAGAPTKITFDTP